MDMRLDALDELGIEIKNALEFIKEQDEITLKEQLEMVQIPAPSFCEKKRGEYVLNKFKDIGLADVYMDEVGNVFGSIYGKSVDKGYNRKGAVMLAAHLDTVFPMDTDLSLKIENVCDEGSECLRYYCPGINDDTRALAELITIARAMVNFDIRGEKDIIFCADVCEEGLGDLKGVKTIFKRRDDIKAFVSIDNEFTGAIIHIATGSRRYEVEFRGKGGHSFGAFGIANPIHAMGRAIAKIADLKVSDEPKTTFNVGVIDGGTSVNTISQSCRMLMDIRSNCEENIEALSKEFIDIINESIREENDRWLPLAEDERVYANINVIGNRPAGSFSEEALIVRLAEKANDILGIESIVDISSSTDANLPTSLNIPAITVGRGGKEANVHTKNEWFEPIDAFLGPQRDLLLILNLSNTIV